MVRLESYSEAETAQIGKRLADSLRPGDVVALRGDLGAGKTAFVTGVASAFGIPFVQSPTFTLVNEYEGSVPLYHFDAYRITVDDWMASGFDEYLFGDGICLIEWSERLEGILPPHTITVSIKRDLALGEQYRRIEVNGAHACFGD